MAEEIVLETKSDEAPGVVQRIYEVGYHIVPTVLEDNLEAVVGAIRSVIEKAGGTFISEGAPTLMKLSYLMTHREEDKNVEYDRGFFGWIKFEAPTAASALLDNALKNDKNILRFIIFRTVREETRARMKISTLREVRRSDTIKTAPRRAEESAEPVSEEDLDKALETLTTD
ncbi:MAG TPA: 30S ribosomal protein S6 [Candidatus Paceibacterota bacterium]|nr:30S ribosomal protein S6 [Candidatus Paceibacterota bacterium]